MNDKLFQELLESVKQGGGIIRGEKKPSREFDFKNPDVKSIRKKYGLTQNKFAQLLGISTATLRNWEQGRRRPEGPARVLLLIAEKHPEVVLESVYQSPK
ncbi:MAG: helix-turn-helix domain-containing protein [Calditrichaeota bacterium]|nr:helix-turn-helix domain-containing protein [Calditrichota bacterium]